MPIAESPLTVPMPSFVQQQQQQQQQPMTGGAELLARSRSLNLEEDGDLGCDYIQSWAASLCQQSTATWKKSAAAARPMVPGLLVGDGKPCFILLEGGHDLFDLPASVLDVPANPTCHARTSQHLSGEKLQGSVLQDEPRIGKAGDKNAKQKVDRRDGGLSASGAQTCVRISGRNKNVPKEKFVVAETFSLVDDSNNAEYLSAEEVQAKQIKSLMLRNFPPSCGQEDVVAKLHHDGFEGLFDFVYAPFDLQKSSTKGYAFINMVSVEAAASLVQLWSGTNFAPQPALRAANLPMRFSPADLQGLEANTRKMLRSKLQRIRNPRLRPYISPTLATTLLLDPSSV